MKKLSKTLLLALATSMVLSACSKPAADTGKKEGEKKAEAPKLKEGQVAETLVIENEGTHVDGAEMKIAYINSSQFTGIFHQAFVSDNPTMSIMQYSMNGTFNGDADYKLSNGGGADIEFKPEEKKAIIKIHPKYTWNDGTPVTSKDFLRYYLIIADKDYDGVRFDDDMKNLVGIVEYSEGKATDIEGFKIVDDKTFELTFKEFGPTILWGGGIPFEPVPDHIYKDIPVKDQAAHDATMKTPLSPGPYVIKDIVPGQQVTFEANPHWYKGEPKVKKILWKTVDPKQITAALQTGEFDLTVGLNADLYPKIKELKNYKTIVKEELSYNYIGFRLGKWDDEKKEVATDPNAKMADSSLRKAIAYAIDNDSIGIKFYHGLRRNATQLIIPAFKSFHDPSLKGFEYNEEEAKKLLDTAGFKDVDGDGLREDKNGKPLVINFATMSGSDVAEPIAQYQLQQWKKIGLNVQLVDGRLQDFNAFYKKLQEDDPGVDMYLAGWGTGSNPNPTGFYSKGAAFNFTRFQSPELNAIFDKINSSKAVEEDYRRKAYDEFNAYMFKEAPVIPVLFRKQITAVNNRIKKYDATPGTSFGIGDVELTAKDPIK